MLEDPLISVLLPVYNCEKYLGAALESVLRQTYQTFEVLVVDDGSVDNSYAVAKRFGDPRIRVLRQENQGLAAALNVGLAQVRGKYVARQDADDISLPERLGRQVEFLERHPECALLGTAAQIFEGDKPTERFHRHPTDCPRLRFELLLNNPFVHTSVMFRKDAVLSLGGYSTDPSRQPPEDYELWSRLARKWEVRNLADVLVHYRETPGSLSRKPGSVYRECLRLVTAENLAYFSGAPALSSSINATAALVHECEVNPAIRLKPEEVYHLFLLAIRGIDPEAKDAGLRSRARWQALRVMGAYFGRRSHFFSRIYKSDLLRRLWKARGQLGLSQS
jgi:glycosyltransferase involved in cell wall biosynthesis